MFFELIPQALVFVCVEKNTLAIPTSRPARPVTPNYSAESILFPVRPCLTGLTLVCSESIKPRLSSQPKRSNDLEDRWRSVDEIAEYLGVSKDTVYAWITQKGMPGHKVGRFWKFKREDVDAWVRDGGAASGSDDDLKEKPGDE